MVGKRSLGALAAALTIGLPLLADGETMGLIGSAEGLDDVAGLTGLTGLTGLVELVSVGVATQLLRRNAAETDGHGAVSPAGS